MLALHHHWDSINYSVREKKIYRKYENERARIVMVREYFPTCFCLKSRVALYITIINIIKTDGHPTSTRNLFLLQQHNSLCPSGNNYACCARK
jgi:hypothetical protein